MERFDVDAVEELRNHRSEADRGEGGYQKHGGDQREGDRHAHVAQEQKQEAHQDDERAVGESQRCRS